MPMVRQGVFYGAIGFAIGFIFGTLRELVLIPWLGAEVGRWLEFPLVVGGVVLAAWWLFGPTARESAARRLAVGAIGVLVLVALESGLALGVLRMPLDAYLAGYDVTQGALFPFGLLVMLLAPLFVARRA